MKKPLDDTGRAATPATSPRLTFDDRGLWLESMAG